MRVRTGRTVHKQIFDVLYYARHSKTSSSSFAARKIAQYRETTNNGPLFALLLTASGGCRGFQGTWLAQRWASGVCVIRFLPNIHQLPAVLYNVLVRWTTENWKAIHEIFVEFANRFHVSSITGQVRQQLSGQGSYGVGVADHVICKLMWIAGTQSSQRMQPTMGETAQRAPGYIAVHFELLNYEGRCFVAARQISQHFGRHGNLICPLRTFDCQRLAEFLNPRFTC
eukprot:TRINITY_DN5381_c0_g1_i1.p2 TRINITY_DN5381_c0_g1~~TRINITY_DN5381_c0_g1_i1.p2  ORF type:complete len:227 (+),score=-26.37 TRINITY_DN5381_c0_g1_i1:332-1012(+)